MTLAEHRRILIAARDSAKSAHLCTRALDKLIQDATTRLLRRSLRKTRKPA